MYPTADSGLPSSPPPAQRRGGSTYYAASYQPRGGSGPDGASGPGGPGGSGGSGGATGAHAGHPEASSPAGPGSFGAQPAGGSWAQPAGGSWAPPSSPAVPADPWVQPVPAAGYGAPAAAGFGAPSSGAQSVGTLPPPEFPPLPEFPAAQPAAPSMSLSMSPSVAAPAPGFPPPGYAPHAASPQPHPAPGAGYTAATSPGSPPARRGKAVPVLLAVLGVVLVLFVAAGVFAYRTFFDGVKTPSGGPAAADTPATAPAAQPSGLASGANTPEEVTGDLGRYKKGDCLTVDDATNDVAPAKCSDAGAYKVLLRKDGTTDDSVCESTEATMSLYEDADGTTRDFVLCVGPAA